MPITPLTLNLTAPALKCSVVLAPAALIGVHVPDGAPRVTLRVQIDKRTLTASVAAKSVRRAIVALAASGPENVAMVLQGRLVGDTIEDAGLSALPKPAKAEKTATPNGQDRALHGSAAE
jgi:hypothetical protein